MRLRFTIRDLFWLTLVVALGVGLWIEHLRQSQFQEWIVTDQNGKIIITDREGEVVKSLPGTPIIITGHGLNWRHFIRF
jgi:hypothetical protein